MSISQASRRTVAVLASLSTAVALVVAGTIPTTTYAAAPAGTVVAWGQNDNGQVTVPPALGGDVVAVAGGGLHSLALRTDGTVAAWGSNGLALVVPPDTTPPVLDRRPTSPWTPPGRQVPWWPTP